MAQTQITSIAFVGFIFIALVTGYVGWKLVAGINGNELQILTEHNTRSVVDIFMEVCSVEQGVRQFDMKKNYAYDLNSTHIRLTYVEDKKKPGEKEVIHTFAVAHNMGNLGIVPAVNYGGVDRICISKKIDDGIPAITICEKDGDCCDLEENEYKYITE